METEIVISEKMKAVSRTLIEKCVGMSHCLISKGRNNIIVEVPRGDCDMVLQILKEVFGDTVLLKNALGVIDDLHDFILVKPMITEAPLVDMDGVPIPSIEKRLVDQASDKEYASLDIDFIQTSFQRSFEMLPVNKSKLLRYASRKGKKAEIQNIIGHIDLKRVGIIKALQRYFPSHPVSKAWIFGSYSRMEEQEDSDVDILVLWEDGAKVTLLTCSAMIIELENLLNRKVDLVSEGAVKPFAADSIYKDRILIYERAC